MEKGLFDFSFEGTFKKAYKHMKETELFSEGVMDGPKKEFDIHDLFKTESLNDLFQNGALKKTSK